MPAKFVGAFRFDCVVILPSTAPRQKIQNRDILSRPSFDDVPPQKL
jgi:hypothetical protein